MDGFVAAVVSRAAVADGNAPVVAATAAAVRAASPRKFTSLSPSLFLLLFSVETESDSGSGIRIPFHDLGLIRIFFSRFESGICQ